ncbi:nuclear transport factor 2 family protein [Virgibacillus flavescens]|uniref:nuclear transport factor 2 family protein n=1 Tax=Virgibacillus flavescens TaxID=1611422 RepID=UPI003D33508A
MNSNKENALSFLQLVTNGNVREAYLSHVASDFCHHNPNFPGDAKSLMLAMEEDAAGNPDKIIGIIRAIEEGDSVVVHSHVKQNTEDLGWAIVHIFRFQEDRIVELWDLVQAVPENSINKNGVF